jgi:rubredoxin
MQPRAASGDGFRMGQCTFLQPGSRPMNQTATPVTYRTWMCVVCGFIYDEAKGLPEEGIAAGTLWEDIPETWTCPDCGVTKSDFEMTTV